MSSRISRRICLAIVALGLGGCASLTESLIATPQVELSNVEVVGLGFNNQTFLLSFNVNNPNSFSLPIDSVAYGVKLDGQRFASGETSSKISVPANGNADFAISVDLDLLKTAPQLLSIMRAGASDDIPYQLEGAFGIDLPMAPIVRFESSGSLRLFAKSY